MISFHLSLAYHSSLLYFLLCEEAQVSSLLKFRAYSVLNDDDDDDDDDDDLDDHDDIKQV